GTLTAGRPVVTNVVSFDPAWEPEQILAYAASSEVHSRHPLAQAVIRSTVERHIQIPPHEQCEVLLRKLLELRDLSRHVVGVIRQNYGMSITVNAAGLAVSAAGALSPVLAAVLHNASSIAVVANSSRAARCRLDTRPGHGQVTTRRPR
ncbi:MAG TPA: hypothetical protein VIZ43_17895, partial [Trebonia sp.]